MYFYDFFEMLYKMNLEESIKFKHAGLPLPTDFTLKEILEDAAQRRLDGGTYTHEIADGLVTVTCVLAVDAT